MKNNKCLMGLTLMLGTAALPANAQNNDFSRSTHENRTQTRENLRERFTLKGEVFVTDLQGNLLSQGSELRNWKFGKSGDLVSNWSYESPDAKFYIKHSWTISKDAKIHYQVEQFDSMKRKENSRDVVLGKLLKKEEKILVNFAPVIWVVDEGPKKKVVVRLTPELSQEDDFLDIKKFPLVLDQAVVFDNKARVWASNVNLQAPYAAFTTHLGRLALSYHPFKGAKEIGFVRDHQMEINAGRGLKIYLKSDRPILPSKQGAKLYGYVDLSEKSRGINSLGISSSGSEENFLSHLK